MERIKYLGTIYAVPIIIALVFALTAPCSVSGVDLSVAENAWIGFFIGIWAEGIFLIGGMTLIVLFKRDLS